MSIDSPKIRVERNDGHAVVFLANPPMNVVSLPLTRELYAALRDLERDDSVRAVIVTGDGSRAFCAGSDITELEHMTEPGAVLEKKLIFQNKVFELLRAFPKPTIAALNGIAYGGGLEIAACCDLIVAERQVRLALPEIRLGVFPRQWRDVPGSPKDRRVPGQGDDLSRRADRCRASPCLGPRQSGRRRR